MDSIKRLPALLSSMSAPQIGSSAHAEIIPQLFSLATSLRDGAISQVCDFRANFMNYSITKKIAIVLGAYLFIVTIVELVKGSQKNPQPRVRRHIPPPHHAQQPVIMPVNQQPPTPVAVPHQHQQQQQLPFAPGAHIPTLAPQTYKPPLVPQPYKPPLVPQTPKQPAFAPWANPPPPAQAAINQPKAVYPQPPASAPQAFTPPANESWRINAGRYEFKHEQPTRPVTQVQVTPAPQPQPAPVKKPVEPALPPKVEPAVWPKFTPTEPAQFSQFCKSSEGAKAELQTVLNKAQRAGAKHVLIVKDAEETPAHYYVLYDATIDLTTLKNRHTGYGHSVQSTHTVEPLPLKYKSKAYGSEVEARAMLPEVLKHAQAAGATHVLRIRDYDHSSPSTPSMYFHIYNAKKNIEKLKEKHKTYHGNGCGVVLEQIYEVPGAVPPKDKPVKVMGKYRSEFDTHANTLNKVSEVLVAAKAARATDVLLVADYSRTNGSQFYLVYNNKKTLTTLIRKHTKDDYNKDNHKVSVMQVYQVK